MRTSEVVVAIKAAIKGNVAVFYPCECGGHISGEAHFIGQLTNSILAIQRQADIETLIESSSIGTPEAKAIRDSVSDDDVARIMDRVNEDQPPVVWKTVKCPTCFAPAGLACSDDEGMRQPRQTHPARTELFYDLTEYRGQ